MAASRLMMLAWEIMVTRRKFYSVYMSALLYSCQSPPSTFFTYDIAGNVVKVVDPRGVETDYGYSDALNTFALPTTITHYPLLGSTAPAFTEQYSYDYNIGKLLTSTDVNSNITH